MQQSQVIKNYSQRTSMIDSQVISLAQTRTFANQTRTSAEKGSPIVDLSLPAVAYKATIVLTSYPCHDWWRSWWKHFASHPNTSMTTLEAPILTPNASYVREGAWAVSHALRRVSISAKNGPSAHLLELRRCCTANISGIVWNFINKLGLCKSKIKWVLFILGNPS